MLSRLAIFSVLAVLATPACGWSAPPPAIISPGTTSEPARFSGMVAAHNHARHAVGVPDLQWSPELANTAQRWANQLGAQNCALRHSGAPGIGENLTWASGQRLSPAEVVATWVQEARSFNGATGACLPGAVCGHYTQVVWRSTRFVGCGTVSCAGRRFGCATTRRREIMSASGRISYLPDRPTTPLIIRAARRAPKDWGSWRSNSRR